MVFIKTGGVLAGSAGYFFKLAGYGRDIGGVSQLMETQLANICNFAIIHICYVYLKELEAFGIKCI
jgi:hypothetical protein